MPTDLDVCRALLPAVSRTFALTIPVLPPALADAVGVAYLVCRVADTVEDRPDLPDDVRRQAFAHLGTVLDRPGYGPAVDRFLGVWPRGEGPEEDLIRALPALSRALAALRRRDLVVACVREMSVGMDASTRRPLVAGVRYVTDDLDDLERYCHYVAGTVGILLTRLFDDHLGGGFATDARLEQGRRFGLGLQLTNVLRDHPEDVARGACYVPRAWLAGARVREDALAAILERAFAHLDAAQAYSLALPSAPEHAGMRLFCLWSAWMAVATLREVAADPHGAPKLPRSEVARIVSFVQEHVSDDGALSEGWIALRQAVTA